MISYLRLCLTLAASMGFLIIGLVRGYSSSAIPSIVANDAALIETTEQKSWVGAIAPLGAFVGSIVSGPLSQKAGRRRALQLTAPLWMAAWLTVGFAPSFPVLLFGRICSGFCVGLCLAPSQVYVSECCDPEIRGRLGSLPTLSMSFGILMSYIAGSWLYWRHLAFLSAIVCGLMFLALLPLPESPVWLQGKNQDASESIKWLQLSQRATATDTTLDENGRKEKQTTNNEETPSLFTRKVFFSTRVMKPLVIGFVLLFFQQFSGIDTVIFFTVEIFETAGSTLDSTTATIIVGLVQLLLNGVSTMLVDKSGRRPLLMSSAVIMSGSMAAMGVAFYFQFGHDSVLGYLPVVSLVLFMIGFSIGFGGVPFLLMGELFPTEYRSQLSAMAGAVNLISMFAVIKSYHVLESLLTSAGTFWMYSCFCALAFMFVLFAVPETTGKSLAEIELLFKGTKHKKNTQDTAMSQVA